LTLCDMSKHPQVPAVSTTAPRDNGIRVFSERYVMLALTFTCLPACHPIYRLGSMWSSKAIDVSSCLVLYTKRLLFPRLHPVFISTPKTYAVADVATLTEHVVFA
jgi:hypothetical protein